MRKKIVAGNWKMNLTSVQSEDLVASLSEKLKNFDNEGKRVIVAPTFVNLVPVVTCEDRHAIVEVAAQNMHQAANGAFTGEIAANMLQTIGVPNVILGHSERRAYFGETDTLLAKKVEAALEHNMQVIFCFGEELEDRKSDKHFDVVGSQLKNALFQLPASAWKDIILAYEPVWAIGTGETASPEQAQEMHEFIRRTIAEAYSAEIADEVSILYGGSVKPANAKEIFSKPDVDGGLIGGASLKADDFFAIIDAM